MNEINEVINKEVNSIKDSLIKIKRVTNTIPRYKKDNSKECTIELYGTDMEVNYNFTKGVLARMYELNGDPGYPGESAEIEIISIKCDDLCMVLDMMDKSEKATKLIEDFYREVEEKILELEYEYDNY